MMLQASTVTVATQVTLGACWAEVPIAEASYQEPVTHR